MEIYYYEGTKRLGPINQAQLKALAMSGVILKSTIIELVKGEKTDRRRAGDIPGLNFPGTAESVPVPSTPDPPSSSDSIPAASDQQTQQEPKTQGNIGNFPPAIDIDDMTSIYPNSVNYVKTAVSHFFGLRFVCIFFMVITSIVLLLIAARFFTLEHSDLKIIGIVELVALFMLWFNFIVFFDILGTIVKLVADYLLMAMRTEINTRKNLTDQID